MSASITQRYLNLRTACLLLIYTVVFVVTYYVAYELRFEFFVPLEHRIGRLDTMWWIVGLKIMMLASFGQFDALLSYFRLNDALRLFGSLFVSAVLLIFIWYIFDGQKMPPRSVILTDMQFSFFALASFRVLMRVKSSRSLVDWVADPDLEQVMVAGAGEVGAGLCAELMNKSRLGMRPVVFIDDDPKKVGRYVHGVLVADSVENLPAVARRYGVTKVVIAFPSASVKRIKLTTELARSIGLKVDIVPALTDLVSGRAEFSQIRPIQPEDLLGRDPVDLDASGISAMLAGKRILVTGAGGSIGSELVSQILDYAPASLVAIDQAEIAIFTLEQEVLSHFREDGPLIRTQVLDVYNKHEVDVLFAREKPEVIFHAAAHKHVNLMESQPGEAVRNNFFATVILAEAAMSHGVERFILISTDKAINPTSVMGASKRLAELSLLQQQEMPANQTKFMAVRFGNVLGSSGSVVPIFRKQLAAGGPITVTDPEVTRFFMTVQEAVGLVLQSATQGVGGEIFVLDMGEPVKILDVARQMIALSGFNEGTDIEIEFTGLRPGEKLYEELQHVSETLQATSHPRVLRFVASSETVHSADLMMRELRDVMERSGPSSVKEKMQVYIPEYKPYQET
ncbi:MAG: nucleoside-diphosphate sugar epimerase/dehydratase [Verrucomicrobiota bacterium]